MFNIQRLATIASRKYIYRYSNIFVTEVAIFIFGDQQILISKLTRDL